MPSQKLPCPIWDEPPFPGGIPHGANPTTRRVPAVASCLCSKVRTSSVSDR